MRTRMTSISKVVLTVGVLLLAGCLTSSQQGQTPGPDEVGARQIPLSGQATTSLGAKAPYALYTHSVFQYAGFFDESGTLVLAKRRLGEDRWVLHRQDQLVTQPGTASFLDLAVDGNNVLHVIWGRDRLGYAVSDEAGSMTLVNAEGPADDDSGRVKDPHLFRHPDGNLLLAYRNSENQLVLDRYQTEAGNWSHVHSTMIETRQNAYQWDLYQQKNGVLHLAWRYDDTTASSLFYARSDDGGDSWQSSAGKAFELPIQATASDAVWHSPQAPSGPVQVTADPNGVPYIGVYRLESDGAARFQVVHRYGGEWSAFSALDSAPKLDDQVPTAIRMLAESKDGRTKANLLYSDPSAEGRLVVDTASQFDAPVWDRRYLTDQPVASNIPEVDVSLWQRMRQVHVLLSSKKYSGLASLIWSTDWEHHLRQYAAGDTKVAPKRTVNAEQDLFAPKTILDYAERVARWQWAHMPDPNGWHFEPRAWGVCPLYIGTLDIAPYLTQGGFDGKHLSQKVSDFASQYNYSLRDHAPYDADDYCVTQAYLRLYNKHQNPDMLKESKALFDRILANPSEHNLDWGYDYSRDRWSWSDSLYMGPMSWLMMWEVTGNGDYLEFMNREWWATTERLYRPEIGLFFRDESYLDIRENNGKTIHWARGTSWSLAGLAQVIERFPVSHPDYERYVALYREMAEAFVAAQQGDGLWRPGLLDPDTHNARETSGTAFIAFALAKGINLGLLDKDRYLEPVQKAWKALTASVADNGKLRNVQPVGAGPHGFDPDNAEPFASGAFLQLAAELYYMEAGLAQQAFRVERPDHDLSPYTGMTREHWKAAARYLLEGAFGYVNGMDDPLLFPKQPGKSYPRDGVHTPTSRLEELTRTLLTAAPLLREQPDLKIRGIPLAEYYRHHIAHLVDPNSDAFILPRSKDRGPHQNLVEFGALSMAFAVAPEVLWEPLSQSDRNALARTMLSYGDGPTVPSNWKFFNIFVLSFLDSQGYDINRPLLDEYLRLSLADYRGQGWYNDNPAYDYYSMWGYQFYGMLWSEFYGKKTHPDIARQFTENFRDMAGTYPHLFNEDGEMIMWGRSISYRFAAVAPLPLLEYAGAEDVNWGWMRRIASSTLLQFLEHPDFLHDGVPTLGFYGPFEPAVQKYSTRGSVFWAGKAFFGLLLPKDSPFWSATENAGPWDTEYTDQQVVNRFYRDSDILITNYPELGGSEIRAWCKVRVIDNWEAFRGSENYNRLAYHSEFPWQADGGRGEVAMNYVVESAPGEWEAFRLFDFEHFEQGVYHRKVVLETDERIRFRLADMPLANGILRVDRNVSSVGARFRLGHYALPDRGDGIRATTRTVHGRDVFLIDNGEYQLAMVPLLGWSKVEVVNTRGLHPESAQSAVLNAEAEEKAPADEESYYSVLMLWKPSGQPWSDGELLPVTNVTPDGSDVTVQFRDGSKQQIRF
jgi:rhamnogalacturonyl hydrolase YesR